MSFTPNIKEEALVACGRHCCLCHRFCGLKIELHHIVERSEGGDDTFANCIPLCFDCHADMRSYDHLHPKGTKYTRDELVRHRDAWYAKIKRSPGVAEDSAHRDLDRATFERVCRILPYDGSIAFLRRNNFAGFSFRWDRLGEVEALLAARDDPAFEFVDADLEGHRVSLVDAAASLWQALGRYTFPLSNPDVSSVPAEWETDMPDEFSKAVNAIHDAASELCGAYDDLVKLARRKLGATARAAP